MSNYVIVIPTYNNNLEDIKKTFSCFDKLAHIFVIDDGSEIPFHEVIGHYLDSYKNLNILTFDENKGIEQALIAGIEATIDKFTYIARMDIGDISSKDRFLKQKEFLDKNNDYVIVGTWTEFQNESGQTEFIHKTPVDDKEIKKMMYKNNMFVHPSVMIRSSALKKSGNYSNRYKACEDYELFFRLLQVGKGHNLPEVLTIYEVNYNSISSKKRNLQITNRIRVIAKNFRFFTYGFYPYYGLIRSVIMLCITRKQSTFLNKFLRK